MHDKFSIVKKIVDQIDPVHLLDSTPEDEYDYEIKQIVQLDFNDEKKLAESIYEIFIEAFDKETAGDMKVYEEMARLIIHQYKQ